MSDTVRQLLNLFDNLPDSDKQTAVVEILRRAPAEGDIPPHALDQLADELFAALDAEEEARAARS